MKNDFRKVLFTCALFVFVVSLSAQLSEHGLNLNGGIGWVNWKTDTFSERDKGFGYKAGLSVGYRLRFKDFAPKSFYYDMDVSIGWKLLNPTLRPGEFGTTKIDPDYFTSIGGTANYSFIKNLSIGLGVEPTYYYKKKVNRVHYIERNSHFDIPLIAKVAYKFKTVEVGIYGKYGLINVLGSKIYQNHRFKYRDIQLSLFIPF